MRPARRLGVTVAALTLACGGMETPVEPTSAPVDPPEVVEPEPAAPPEPEDPTAWVDEAVREALDWEIMPGTSGEEGDDGQRAEALRTFFLAHPEYAEAEAREPLAAHACGMDGTEAAHEWLTNPPPKVPLVIEVDDDEWRLLVAHADVHCTSDDWAWYSSEAISGAEARGAKTAWAGPDEDLVVVRVGGEERIRLPLTGQGFFVARANAKPGEIAYDPSAITSGLDDYFGPVP
ncbi:MAG: hypothetical protein KC621_07815 [Myxococcales bacterium]|nr:hypothetical protein [Myxococcales bacterium]